MRAPWTARRSNQSTPKEINPEYSLKGLKLRLQYFGHLMGRTNSLENTLMLERLKARGEGDDRGRMVGWHHRLDGHVFEQAPGVGDATQPSHPLSSPSLFALNLYQHQGLF